MIYEPTAIRRRARAEADSTVIRATAEAEAAEILDRARARIAAREVRRQRNLEAIVTKAIPQLPETGSGAPLDEDWVAEFANASQDTSDEHLQSLWARILAGETASPGRFSRRTLQSVRVLSKIEADLFTRFCSFVWLINDDAYHVIPPHWKARTGSVSVGGGGSSSERIAFEEMMHLRAIGLITENEQQILLRLPGSRPHLFRYMDTSFQASITDADRQGVVVLPLTTVGSELAPITGAQVHDEYRDLCVTYLKRVLTDWQEITATV